MVEKVVKNRIRELREDKDLKQSELAAATGIDQRTISNYETGKSNPDSYALLKLADYFNVSVDYILCRTNKDYFYSKNIKSFLNEIIDSLQDLKKMI